MITMITPTELKQKIKSKYALLKDNLFNYDSFHTAKEISLFYDSIIIEAFSLIKGGSEYCIVAGGSYSNLELCPYSDIDIMILTENGLSAEDSARDIKDFFYLFWDAGVDLAQSVMTSAEAIELMSSDLNTYTSFINARYITGNKSLFDKFTSDFKKIDAKLIFLKEIMKRLRKRRLINVMTDNDIFLLEPDVKEAIGGLRDYSYCGWIYYLGVKDIFPNLDGGGEIVECKCKFKKAEEMVIAALKANNADTSLKKEDITNLYEGKKFILKTRIMMHLLAGKKMTGLLSTFRRI